MFELNPHIRRAQQSYDRSVELIRAMDGAFQRQTGVAYDCAITLVQFDRILQAILLNMALIDGCFHRLERRLIEGMGEHGDLMDWLRGEGIDLTWAQAGVLEPQRRQELLDQLPGLLEQTCNDFVRPLALADIADPVDYLEDLQRQLEVIADAMAQVDGESCSEEQNAYVHMLRHLLTDRWQAIVAEG